ncbi:hypothetical protein AD998_08570 [bacterium 336/3]|nr:hypothetical protein AD998_08570 [bacterium 336/3]
MNQEEYMGILNEKFTSQVSLEADLFEFLQLLYVTCLQKHQEKPTYTVFMECLMDAYVSTERFTEEAFAKVIQENEEAFKKPDEDFYMLLHFISSEETFWHNRRISCFSETLSEDWHHFSWNISYIFYGTIYDFLAKPKTKKLFTQKNVCWKDFIELIQLLIIPIDTVLLCSNSAEDTLNYLKKHDNLYVTDKTIGLYAWVATKWRMAYLPWRYNIHDFDDFLNYKEFLTHFYSKCQAFIADWREKSYNYGENPENVRYEIYHRIFQILEKQLSKEKTSAILKAAQLFDIAYPEQYGIGNADGTFYDENIEKLTHNFYPYREYFVDALLESELDVLQYEWITVTQVLWQYYRWTTNYTRYQKILETLEYLFEKAITLSHEDIHYMSFNGKTPKGAINFYYAEFLYYQKQDYDQALKYYEIFVKLEPQFLPNNLIDFSPYFIDKLIYPISTQEALTQIAKIYLLKEDFEKAKTYVKKAIKMRSNNYQAPYEVLAEIYEKQDHLKLAIDALNNKIKAMEQSIIISNYSKPTTILYYTTYDPLYKDSIYHNHSKKVNFIYDYYFKISELYNWLGESEKAGKALNDGNRLKKRMKI